MPTPQPVVVLDFGSQYTQLIARRIRELQVYAVIVPCNIPFDDLVRMSPQALILSGGPSSVYDPASPVCDERVLKLNLPVLGICYGLQWMAYKLGGKVEPAGRREYGFAELDILPSSRLLAGFPSPLKVWNSHGDHVVEVPPGFAITGRTLNAISVIENPQAQMYALEFHPEVRHTTPGQGNPAALCFRRRRHQAQLVSRDRLLSKPSKKSVSRWGTSTLSARFRGAWTQPSPRPWWGGRWATG